MKQDSNQDQLMLIKIINNNRLSPITTFSKPPLHKEISFRMAIITVLIRKIDIFRGQKISC